MDEANPLTFFWGEIKMSATSRQTWALFCMTKKDHRPFNLTLEKASEIIGKLKNGEVVSDCLCGETHQVKPRMTEEQVLAIIREARAEGRKAGEEQLAKLQGQGEQWIVKDGFTGEAVGTMLDVCGNAWLIIDARQPFYRIAKEITKQDGSQKYRFSCDHDSYRGGGHLSIYDMSMRQEVSVNQACYEKAKEVLESHGVKVEYVHTYID